jgi:hypothetical protein
MRSATCWGVGVVIDRRSQEWVAELEGVSTDPQDARALGRIEDITANPESLERVDDGLHPLRPARRGQQQRQARVVAQPR